MVPVTLFLTSGAIYKPLEHFDNCDLMDEDGLLGEDRAEQHTEADLHVQLIVEGEMHSILPSHVDVLDQFVLQRSNHSDERGFGSQLKGKCCDYGSELTGGAV